MGHGIFPSYGKQWIKSGEFDLMSKSEKNSVFFPRGKKKISIVSDKEEEEDIKINRKKKK